ncbi:MAG: ATP-binding protein [Sphingobacteriales bacterium]|nr:ATP-binding protein [Sphingobacteriales bacterium]MCC7224806.1 ATP-binding protein [Chitinophagales bacterium]
MIQQIGKVVATERAPSTVDEFYFWTQKNLIIKPFDVVKVKHIKHSTTFGVVEEISHITDSASSLAGFISSDFGDVEATTNTDRIGMNYVKARVVGNTGSIYTPVLDGQPVSLADEDDIKQALGLSGVKHPIPCGYIEMYEENPITIPVHFNSHFLIGPEGAHLNISGISGLASKTSYAMFLMKAIQDKYIRNTEGLNNNDSVAFVVLNVKGRDLLGLDEENDELDETNREIYLQKLRIPPTPFENVKYFYPYAKNPESVTYGRDFESQRDAGKAHQYAYTYESDREKIEMLFANVDDTNETMSSIVAQIASENSEFSAVTQWADFKTKLSEYKQSGNTGKDKEITVLSWRKFSRHFNRVYEKNHHLFNDNIEAIQGGVRLQEAIQNINKNDVLVVDIAKLSEEMQGFVFGDVVSAIYDLKLGQIEGREEFEIPSKIIIFIDELNKYASKDIPKNSPILRRVLEVTERGRSLGIILFSAEQFKSDIHDRVKGNCATHAYGRSNAIEVSKSDYQYVPPVYKSMMTRLEQGEYILQNPVFRSLLSIKFPKPIYRQFKNG